MNELNPRLNSWVWMINMAFCWGDLSYVLLLRLIWKSLFGWRLGAQWRSKDVMLRIAWPAKINFTNVCLSIESSIERWWVLEPVETYLVSSCWRSNVYCVWSLHQWWVREWWQWVLIKCVEFDSWTTQIFYQLMRSISKRVYVTSTLQNICHSRPCALVFWTLLCLWFFVYLNQTELPSFYCMRLFGFRNMS